MREEIDETNSCIRMVNLMKLGGDSKFPHFWGQAWERDSKGKQLNSVYPLLLSHQLAENESIGQSPQYVLSQDSVMIWETELFFFLVYRVVEHWNGDVTIPRGVKLNTTRGTQCHYMIFFKVVSQRLDLIISEVIYNLFVCG